MRITIYLKSLLLTVVIVSVAACGGGGSSPQSTPPEQPPQTAPGISVSGSAEFGEVFVGATKVVDITITNTGDGALTLGTLSGLQAPFSLIDDNCTAAVIASASSCTSKIQFAPTIEGETTATLLIPSNASDETLMVSGSASMKPCEDTGTRTELTFCGLTAPQDDALLVNMNAFVESPGTSTPSNTFEGRLKLNGEATSGHIVRVGGTANNGDLTNLGPTKRQHLPEFDFEFIQDGRDIIPVVRGVMQIRPGEPGYSETAQYEYVLEPGRVWDEPDDKGYSRVSIPFALQRVNQNAVHNGVLSFLFKDDGSVSNVAYQISSETNLLFKADMWGVLDAVYTPSDISNADAIKSAYQKEVNSRMPTKPISELIIDFPNLGLNLANFGANVAPQDMTAYGVVATFEGTRVHYVGGCETRAGTYPYCDVLVLPSYSTAKTMFAGVGLMALEQRYPGEARVASITDYVPECATLKPESDAVWADVSFENTLDMTTGNYISSASVGGFELDINTFARRLDSNGNQIASDEDVRMTGFLFDAHTDAEKIDFACNEFPRGDGQFWDVTGTVIGDEPAEQWVYHTSDTYIATSAMNRFLQEKTGNPDADLFEDVIVADIFAGLNMSPTARVSNRTYDNTAQAWGGYGLLLHRDDMVKMADFLNVDAGVINGVPFLDSVLLDVSMQKVPSPFGHEAANGFFDNWGATYYKNGVWSYDVNQVPFGETQRLLGCPTPGRVDVPFMSGFGGVNITMLPNGMTYYYVSDGNNFLGTWTLATIEANKIINMCPAAP